MTRQFPNLTAKQEWKQKYFFARSYMRDALAFSGTDAGISEGWRCARLAAGYFAECFPWAFDEGGAA